ncbi:transcriptional regulator, partial [Streptomyces zhihengii]
MAARPLVARQPNERLQALIQEAGCSNAGLARRVNMVGVERGLDLRYDKTSVARWLRGQQPRGRAPSTIAE